MTALPSHTRKLFLGDLVAANGAAFLAILLSIVIASASGAPPEASLVTGIICVLLIFALGGRRLPIGGPTAAFVVVHGAIAERDYDELVLATLMAGAVLMIGGLLRTGSLISS